MTQANYSSKDFDKTPPQIETQIPEVLIHKNIEAQEQSAYSKARKHPVYFIDLPSKTLSMTLGGLEANGRSNKHRHSYETLIYIIEGEGYSVIEGNKVEWQAGDAIYIPVWAWHQHFNLKETQAKYIAAENAPLLQNLGQLAIREEPNE